MPPLDRRTALGVGFGYVAGFGLIRDARADEPDASFCPCVDTIDRYVAWTAGWHGRADDADLWAPVCEWVAALTAATQRPIPTPFQDADDLVGAVGDTAVVTRRAFTVPTLTPTASACKSVTVVAPEVVIPGPLWLPSVMVSRGRVTGDDVRNCVVVANGDVNVRSVEQSVVVSDGDLTLRGVVRQSVVISRGDIRVFAASRSSVVAGGRVISIHPWAANRENAERVPNHTYRGGAANAFGVVRFTSPSDLGVDAVSELSGGVRVATAVPGGLFPHGAFRAGDELLRVNDTPVVSADDFRCRVRDANAVGREVVVTARRSGRSFSVVGPTSRPPR